MNTQTQEALKMAIEGMVRAEKVFDDIGLILIKFGVKPSDISFHKESFLAPLIQACKDALEQPEQYDLIQGEPLDADDDGLYYVPKQPAQEPVALLEALSDLEHQQWMKWAQSIIDSERRTDYLRVLYNRLQSNHQIHP